MLTTCIFNKPLYGQDINVGREDFRLFVYVLISDLHPNQLNLDMDVVKMKMKNPKKNTMPYVYHKNGDLVLLDGHHTVVGKILKGIKKVKCLFYLPQK